MGTRERNRDSDRDRNRPTPEPENPGSEGNASRERLDALRADAAHLLNAADETITRALSIDSEQFLQAARQEGGE
jgi:hypothetical protein